MASNVKSPPVFHPEEYDDYSAWKNDLEIWRLVTDFPKTKLGPVVYLNLKGKAREAVRNMKAEDLGKEDGIDQLIQKLDDIYLKDESTRAYLAFKKFYNYRRNKGADFSEFIVEYEKKYSDIQRFKMELPENVQAFFLLNAANLTVETEKLARATAELNYTDMKKKLMKIAGEAGLDDSGGFMDVKDESLYTRDVEDKKEYTKPAEEGDKKEVFLAGGYERNRGRRWRSRGNSRGGYSTGGYRGSGRSGYRKDSFGEDRYTRRDAGGDGSSRRGFRENTGFRGARSSRNENQMNPVGYEGVVLRCFECDSKKHLVDHCPHRHDVEDVNMNVHITLLNSKPDPIQRNLLAESLGKGLLDSGCSKTVTGDVWLDEYIGTLQEAEKRQVRYGESRSIFRFGDGIESRSEKSVTIPIVVGGKRYSLDVDVVRNDIPLLISKAAMKQMQMKLDFVKDTAKVGDGKEIKLHCTSSGHYCLPITSIPAGSNVILHVRDLNNLTYAEKKRKAWKLHKQFSHAGKEKLIKLLKNSNYHDSELFKCIEQCNNECELCQKYRKPPLRPAVGLPLSDKFNDVVAMDLKEITVKGSNGKVWILHLIDTATRYSAASLIKTKRKEVVVGQIFRIWISYFGSPRKIMSDNGGEFCNDVMHEMCEKLGIEIVTTAAESPFSNGIVERHNAILYEAMSKTLEDVDCEPDMALAWALSAKNALQNKDGYSSNQLVLGYNVNLPTILNDQPPAWEPTTSADIIRRNLNAMHQARVNYLKSENSERIRRALRTKTRTSSDVKYENGEKVFYRRKSVKGWKGPATVLGQDGKLVLVRHGGSFYRCHPCHLMKMNKKSVGRVIAMKPLRGILKKLKGKRAALAKKVRFYKERQTQSMVTDEDDETDDDDETDYDDETDDEIVDAVTPGSDIGDSDTDTEIEASSTEYDVERANDIHEEARDDRNTSSRSVDVDISMFDMTDEDAKGKDEKPKIKSYIKYMLENGTMANAKVLSVQPKRTGTHGNWVNVHVDGEEDTSSINWKDVIAWKELPEPEYAIYLSTTEEMTQEIIDAKEKEIINLTENDVFEWVNDENQTCISCRWIFSEKFDDAIRIVKARLVARGFEEMGLNRKTDSPTCSRLSLRMVFAVAPIMSWNLHSLDITSAFLQGNAIEREVYLRLPPEVGRIGKIWKLKRCIYGLNDAPRAWYDKIRDEFVRLGGKKSLYDDALFLWHSRDGKLEGILVSHVDDFVFCGTDDWHRKVLGEFKCRFKISSEGQGSFKYVGLKVHQTETEVYVDQCDYVRGLKEIKLSHEKLKQKDDLLTHEEIGQLRSLSGQLLWVTSQTRPDCSFDSCVVSNYGNKPTIRNIIRANKAIRKVKSMTSSRLRFSNLGEPKKLKVLTFADATHASLPSGASQGSFIVFLAGNNMISPITWQSKKMSRITKSPMASEALALGEGADAGFLVASVVQEIFTLPSLPQVQCYTDNKSVNDTLQTSRTIQDMRMRVDVGRIREMVRSKEIIVKWITNDNQLADALTKDGASAMKLLEVLKTGKLQ